ncbi:hypothetical protein Tsubulata_003369 [Turnera subulata]|uniref:Uncharacterized protein n=1 Tax=Turnera subulata TaxID=218843 RepID=A0A9Q0GGA0_9ROSI|nr:hypothetical protein Tsubulata_003369 [Turnera subulata]
MLLPLPYINSPLKFLDFYMENSMNSKSRPLSSSSSHERTTASTFDEESGWTMYFEDFFASNNDNDEYMSSNFSYDDETSSMVSDATSWVVKKSIEQEQVVGLLSVDHKGYNNRLLSFKKRRNNGALVDDALEDTASSPVNSPKVCDALMGQFKNTKRKDHRNISQENGNAPTQQLQLEEKSKLGFIDQRENDSTELKKRGLCVVPLSRIVNFLG